MEMTELIDIVNAVASIEQDIYESTGDIEYFNVTVLTNGFSIKISFLDIDLWSNDDDCRLYAEDGLPKESIEVCLRRRINEELKKIASIKI